MNALDFFIKKAKKIRIECYHLGRIYLEFELPPEICDSKLRRICLDNDYGKVELECYELSIEPISGRILDDEIFALFEFIPDFKAGQDELSQIISSIYKSFFSKVGFEMCISASEVEVIGKEGENEKYSCKITRNQELYCFRAVPEELKKEMLRIASPFWDLWDRE